jgi:hypothetical protein
MKPQWNLQETINSILMKHSFCHFFGSTICQFRGVAPRSPRLCGMGEKKRRQADVTDVGYRGIGKSAGTFDHNGDVSLNNLGK